MDLHILELRRVRATKMRQVDVAKTFSYFEIYMPHFNFKQENNNNLFATFQLLHVKSDRKSEKKKNCFF